MDRGLDRQQWRIAAETVPAGALTNAAPHDPPNTECHCRKGKFIYDISVN